MPLGGVLTADGLKDVFAGVGVSGTGGSFFRCSWNFLIRSAVMQLPASLRHGHAHMIRGHHNYGITIGHRLGADCELAR